MSVYKIQCMSIQQRLQKEIEDSIPKTRQK